MAEKVTNTEIPNLMSQVRQIWQNSDNKWNYKISEANQNTVDR